MRELPGILQLLSYCVKFRYDAGKRSFFEDDTVDGTYLPSAGSVSHLNGLRWKDHYDRRELIRAFNKWNWKELRDHNLTKIHIHHIQITFICILLITSKLCLFSLCIDSSLLKYLLLYPFFSIYFSVYFPFH